MKPILSFEWMFVYWTADKVNRAIMIIIIIIIIIQQKTGKLNPNLHKNLSWVCFGFGDQSNWAFTGPIIFAIRTSGRQEPLLSTACPQVSGHKTRPWCPTASAYCETSSLVRRRSSQDCCRIRAVIEVLFAICAWIISHVSALPLKITGLASETHTRPGALKII